MLAPAAVEAVRDAAEDVVVLGDLGVEQQQRDAPHVGTPDLGAQPPAVRHGQPDPRRGAVGFAQQREGQALRVQDGVVLELPPVARQRLVEVAVLVQQAHAHHGHAHVGGGLEVIAGQDAETARVLRQDGGDAVLGGEVGDRARAVATVLVLVPQRLAQVGLEVAAQGVDAPDELAVLGDLLDLLAGQRAQDLDGIPAGGRPGLRAEIPEELLGGPVPGPAQIGGQSAQRTDRLGEGRPDGEPSDGLHTSGS